MQSKQANKQDLEALYSAFVHIKTTKEAYQFLEDLCTPMELSVMADRWKVVKEIKKNKPYRQIYAQTGVSVTTVGRIARCITHGYGGYNLIYNRTISED
ncbi:YerC/YecD family TrpR-related protein [Thiotrichales bacterium 19S3-7]|nr:YerC/YecD family TrpR-related protein [Thiotrichales bacterium 19S3-7]MCF6801651.1 YerC/YecD family TrpR-related protein [Thiotrichales bacterium 19S3-11]